jgi:hypothetical protein
MPVTATPVICPFPNIVIVKVTVTLLPLTVMLTGTVYVVPLFAAVAVKGIGPGTPPPLITRLNVFTLPVIVAVLPCTVMVPVMPTEPE